MDRPLWKNANFVGFRNRCLSCLERLVCFTKRRKSFFRDLFSRSMTWEYRGLQGVAEGYKVLQAVKRGYRGLQGITKGDGGLQGVTGAYRGLQRIIKFFFITRTFPDAFSWSILHEHQS